MSGTRSSSSPSRCWRPWRDAGYESQIDRDWRAAGNRTLWSRQSWRVDISEWAPALYCGGISPAKGLEVIHNTFAQTLPQLKVWTPRALAFRLLDPWTACKATEVVPPAPFNVQTPRGKRHALAQLELQPKENEQDSDEHESVKYMLSLKSARCCGAKHMSTWKVLKSEGLGPLLELEKSKKCQTFLRLEAHLEVNSV